MDQEQSTAELDKDIVTINGVKCKPNWDVKTYLYIGEDSRGIKKGIPRQTELDRVMFWN